MARTQETNEMTSRLLRSVGTELFSLNEFAPEMVVLEGLVAGLIATSARLHNRHPDEIVAALCAGIHERTNTLVYGGKQ